ncbi:NAD(P)-dependent oxidoreductase [Martelella mediterranea]|uniref:NAD-dependent epimerase/dehydratase family protein n=1 Tax=Martelella mediterranea TaxID=293089 RepID=UPI001E3C20A0|nr:NAD(P)-dependent oxidoreductase [Martelella mediterranea]MCD1634255.1 NAD(P)-dependent oxidoreductase [Martelella mediterranea]
MSGHNEKRMPLTVLVTGGSGFLGQSLADALAERGDTVIVFDLNLPPEEARLPGVTYVEGDITRSSAIDAVIARFGVNAILHLAALVIPACRSNPVLGAKVNVIGHINILEAAVKAGIDRVVYASSLAARPRGSLDSPANLYGVFKHCCEEISKVYFLDHGLGSVGLRPNVVYGPGRTSGETAAITLAMQAAARGEAYELPFSGKMCFQHVDEVTEIFLRCLDKPASEPVVSDLTTEIESMHDVADAIRAVVPGAAITVADNPRPVPETMDNAPLRAFLGTWTAISLVEGTQRTIEVFRETVES